MEKKRIKTRTEFYFFNRNQTLSLEEPAETIFINCGALGDRITINNGLVLDSTFSTNQGVAQFPNVYTIKRNPNEVDATNYTIQFGGALSDPRLYVIAKYYVEE